MPPSPNCKPSPSPSTAGRDLDKTFGLIETAEIYMKIAHLPLVNTITDGQLRQMEKHFGVTARESFLE